MHYVWESVFVGFYCFFLFIALSQTGLMQYNMTLFLFTFGFVKHMLGYALTLHNYYCKSGYACKSNALKTGLKENKFHTLLESVGEGILFVAIGQIPFTKTPISFFFIGFSLHILFEWLGFHKIFCDKRCLRKN
jgi:hypothetical protein